MARLSQNQRVAERVVLATALAQCPVGAVVHDRLALMEDPLPGYLESREFGVDFGRTGWEWRSVGEVLREYGPSLPWLAGIPSDSQLIVFGLQPEGSLIVPCVEFFARYYGNSAELRRILLTYPWVAAERRLFGDVQPVRGSVDSAWQVTSGPRLVEEDCVFLAHIWHDEYARSCAKRIWAQRSTAWPRGVPLQVGPWFGGRGVIVASAYPLGRNAYFVVRIDGGSQPTGPDIERLRERTSATDGRGEDPSQDDPSVVSRKLGRLPKDLLIHRDRNPDAAVGYGSATGREFKVVGPRRRMTSVGRSSRAGSRRRVGSGNEAPDEYSTSEPASTGEGIGYLRIETPVRLLSRGALLDMWTALVETLREYPEIVTSVEWYTPQGGFRADPQPELIAFPRSGEGTEGKAARGWRVFNPDSDMEPRRPRGMLVVRVKCVDGWFAIVEIERRPRAGRTEESFSGLVFPLQSSDDLGASLAPVLGALPAAKGVFGRVVGVWPSGAKRFRHSHAPRQRFACEAAVRNAFRKMGYQLSSQAMRESEL